MVVSAASLVIDHACIAANPCALMMMMTVKAQMPLTLQYSPWATTVVRERCDIAHRLMLLRMP